MMNDFHGKNFLITGGSRGLGEVSVRHFAAQGARIAFLARSEEQLNRIGRELPDPSKHLPLSVDLTDFDALARSLTRVEAFLGRIDVVLHVAGGGLGLHDPLLAGPELLRLFTLNVAVAAEINRLVIPGMRERQGGNLVHVGSISGQEANASVGYNTVKTALSAYVRSLGKQVAAENIVATGILPGGFVAPGNSWVRLQQNKPEVVTQFIEERLPRKRLAEAEELLPLLGFLASEQASMMSGSMVPVDAGEGSAYVLP